ncbi:bifunctional acetaldehyde-CoA/alcohol dehydrogenase [Lentisphaerota bacterium ZTH]|nr:bifunctional acetaldehyde-CoA/alcohol dehydrogenase [Lentisphaerota bacterium]WET05468.1 bifunctional acetaldehyde-CoA/alcohol dehydrogenase [Lentisphaerota bacterium ZTH]
MTKEKKDIEAAAVDTQLKNLDATIARVKAAQTTYATFTQKQVDEIFRAAALAANNARIALAKMAVAETGMGVIEDKVIKNHFASEYVYNKYKNTPTCDEIERDESFGIIKVAEPVGVIAGVVPTTNPTSTAIFKSLMALKTRNGIIFSPHPRAKKCTIAAAEIVLKAAEKAGAPAGLIGWIEEPSVALSQHLMSHKDISLILATGGPGMVKAAYSSGLPALGVGAGNTPAVMDETCDIEMAVSSVLQSKTFDNGMICASEQSVVAVNKVYREVKAEFEKRGAYLTNKAETEKLADFIIQDGKLNAAIVGQPAHKIAEMAGFKVPREAKVLIAEAEGIGFDYPLSYEKLSPVLALYKARDYIDAFDKAQALVEFGGLGHTSVLYTDPRNKGRIDEFGKRMKAGRTLINMPSSQGAIGDVFNFRLDPSMTLGCGSWGGNSVSQNVGPQHLINIKTVAQRRENMLWFRVPPKIYFKYGCLQVALSDLSGKKRAFIVTDRFLYNNGHLQGTIKCLEDLGIQFEIFADVEPDPTLATAKAGVERMNAFKPDVIIALGGGSPMDAAKIMWLMYEHPDVAFDDIAMRFMDIRKRVYKFPKLGEKALMVAIPTTSGTGSEVTPFAVITDEKTDQKYPLADYELTPDIAIIDTELVMSMPKKLTAYSGLDALTHALEARVSILASEYTNALAMEAIRLLFKYLPAAYENGPSDQKAREKVHHASTIAGMAFANAFLGICHSMAHKLGAEFHVPHGLANAMLISEVIKFNATNKPTKQGTFSQYKCPEAKTRYADIATFLKLGGKTENEKVEKLIEAIEKLKARLDIPESLKEYGIQQKDFENKVDELSEKAFDDQCTGANPRYPLISEIKELYMKVYNGR